MGTETLSDILQRTVKATPNATALVDPPNRAEITDGVPRRLTYAQLQMEVDLLATVLLEQGLTSGLSSAWQ